MSSMLEQAIVEAEELKRIASRNAEQAILEKYSRELKEEMENLIEQDLGGDEGGLGLGGGMDFGGGMDLGLGGEEAPAGTGMDFEGSKDDEDEVPTQLEYAAFDDMVIGKTKYPKAEEVVEINLDALSEYELNPESGPTARNIAESIEIDESLLAELKGDDPGSNPGGAAMEETDKLIDPKDKKKNAGGAHSHDDDDGKHTHEGKACNEAHPDLTHEAYLAEMELSEEIELSEEALEEAIRIDYRFVKEGNPFGSDNEQDEFNLVLAALKQEADELNAKNESLSRNGKKLVRENTKYKKNFDSASKKAEELKDGYSSLLEKFKKLRIAFDESQLMNAKLVYTNQVLSDDKLNVRQKNKIVESIQETTSVNNAKVMYETLVNAVESTSKRGPESLSEAVSRRASPLLIKAAKTEGRPSNDFANRMRQLAGIDI